MFEYMIQGMARAGGVELPDGKTVLPQSSDPGMQKRLPRRRAPKTLAAVSAWMRVRASGKTEPGERLKDCFECAEAAPVRF